MYLNCNVPPIKVWVRKEYLYDMQREHGKLQQGILVSAKSIPGTALTFQVLLDNGVMRDKLPVSSLASNTQFPDEVLPLDFLQLWNCFSYNITFSEFNFITGLRVSVLMKNKKWYKGTIIGSFDWSGETHNSADFSLCEHPDEHKSGHFIELDNGQYAIQPNNRIKWFESSFVTKPFPEKPDYKVCTEFFNVEQSDKWRTEDSDAMFYGIEKQD